jgi:hypothetical protein
MKTHCVMAILGLAGAFASFCLQTLYWMRHIIEMRLDQEVQMRVDQSSRVSPSNACAGFKGGASPQLGRLRWRRACAGLAFATALTCIAQDGHPAAASVAPANASPEANTQINAKLQAESSQQPQSAADSQKRKQISVESTQLLAMAVDLKAEVDKTNKDTLSINVIRKADAIEKLAKTVKEKLKQNSGPS